MFLMPDSPVQETGFQGLRVVSFESRRGQEMTQLISERGGRPTVAASMQEVPLEHNKQVFRFAEKLLAGGVDVIVFLTGVGAETLFAVLETRCSPSELANALSRVRLIARGAKPQAVLRQKGFSCEAASEPETWREVLTTLDQKGGVAQKTVALQEYGAVNQELIDGIAQRGAKIVRLPVYRWALPDDREPLKAALYAVIDGQADVVLFTNSHQIQHILQLAQEEGLEQRFREGLAKTVVASVGPICTQYLDEYGLPVDLEPEKPRMGELVSEASQRGPSLLREKRLRTDGETADRGTERQEDGEKILSITPSLRPFIAPSLNDSSFMKACRREPTAYTPIWLMRQAGRYMKEYRDLRERHGFLDLCKDSDLATEVSVYAVERLAVDAAIVFSDILLLLEPMGLILEYAKGDGPIIHNPVRTVADVARLRALEDPAALGFVMQAIQKTRRALPAHIPLIGFAGAPFTLASYMIEGMGSRNYVHTKSFMYHEPAAWHSLLKRLAESLVVYLNAQIDSGAQAVQLFDSWVGCLSPEDYRRYVLPHSRFVIQNLRHGVPVLHFGTGTGSFIELIKEAGGDVIGLDWRIELDEGWRRLGDVAVQGNLDPVALFAEIPEIKRQAERILKQAAGKPGHIFNLGHGILPNTPVGHVKALVDAVHELSEQKKS
jgi:uroporphyrinogen decarboxylase